MQQPSSIDRILGDARLPSLAELESRIERLDDERDALRRLIRLMSSEDRPTPRQAGITVRKLREVFGNAQG